MTNSYTIGHVISVFTVSSSSPNDEEAKTTVKGRRENIVDSTPKTGSNIEK